MKPSNLGLLAISAFLSISFFGMGNSFADSNSCTSCFQIPPYELELYQDLFPLTIWTDSHVYDHNSIVKVNGHLRPENTVSPILIVITNPIGNVVTVEQITPQPNGDFSLDLNTQSPLWKQDGDYVVKAQSGSDTRQFKTKFTLVTYDHGIPTKCTGNEFSILADNESVYCISFTSTKGTNIHGDGKLDLTAKTLSIKIRGQDADSIVFDIPRYILDSKTSSGDDSKFTVLTDEQIINHKELSSDSDSRQIQIDYDPSKTHTYHIVGTHVVPEFGTVAMLILIGSIGSILVVSRSFSNRFVKF